MTSVMNSILGKKELPQLYMIIGDCYGQKS